MKSIFYISIAILLFTACESLEDASTKEVTTPEAKIEMEGEEFVVVAGEEGSSLNKFNVTKPIYYTDLGSDITKYNKSHIKAISCKSASLTIATDEGEGTVIHNLVMSTDASNASTFNVAEYTLGDVLRTAETKQYAEKLGQDIVARGEVRITGTGETDAPVGTHFKVNLVLEEVTVQVTIAN